MCHSIARTIFNREEGMSGHLSDSNRVSVYELNDYISLIVILINITNQLTMRIARVFILLRQPRLTTTMLQISLYVAVLCIGCYQLDPIDSS